MGARGARSSPGNQRRRVCLTSSVLARCPGVDSACGVRGPGCRSKHSALVGGSRMAARPGGLVPECNFDTACLIGPWHCPELRCTVWAFADPRKVTFKEHHLSAFLSFLPASAAGQHIPGFVRQKINTRTLIRALATCHIPCTTAAR